MKTIEIKGIWGFILFAVVGILIIAAVTALPIAFTWVAWNAIVGEAFKGPMISYWQASILTAIFAVIFKIIFQPQLSLHVKRVKSPDDLDKHLRKLKKQDSSKD